MIDELKSCPFCGGKAEIRETMHYGFFVMCKRCLTSSDNYKDEDFAIQHWNSRTHEQKFNSAVEAHAHELYQMLLHILNDDYLELDPDVEGDALMLMKDINGGHW